MQITATNTLPFSGLSTLLSSNTPQADARGLTLGRYSEESATTPVLSAKSMSAGTSDIFASEILRRLQDNQTASNAGALIDSGAAGALQQSLAEAIDTIREKHGDAAATAVMGIVLKGVGDGSGGEDSLGNALVSSLKFIDHNFGIAAGDAAIANFNGALNEAVNGYFQNGHDEKFLASDGTGSMNQIQSVLSATLDSVSKEFGDDTAKAVSDILKSSLEETGVNREGLGTALTAANAYLQDQYGEETTDLTAQPGILTDLAKGSVLDLTV